ncbi:MAG: tetratricopeptide repeat protein [Alphaproteobacteria bacterium]|nr:tetratricopeptide repeat protein [Alphaproteobacteria bacterium]
MADQNDPRLPALFTVLSKAERPDQAWYAETRIWAIWHEYNGDKRVARAMRDGLAAMSAQRFAEAIDGFDEASRLDPNFAEAWNKRATVFYLMGDLERSIVDVRRTLALEPRHFGALSGLGLIYLQMNRLEDAIKAFEAALKIHPFLPAASQIEALRDRARGEKT